MDCRQVGREEGFQQRAPRQNDGCEGRAGRDWSWQLLGRGSEEDGVRKATATRVACGTARSIGHCGRIGIDADCQLVGILSGAAENGLTAARTNIDRHSLVGVDQLVQLADVHLEETLADDLSHVHIVAGTLPNFATKV